MASNSNLTTDADLLKYEPRIFDYAPLHQVLVSGTDGVTNAAGTGFSSAGSNFTTAGIAAGHVVMITEDLSGVTPKTEGSVYPITSTDSATAVTLTYVAPKSKTGVDFKIYTFDPQHSEAMWDFLQFSGFNPNDTDDDRYTSYILNTDDVRRCVAFKALAIILRGAASGDLSKSVAYEKSQYYEREYMRLRRVTRVEWDTDEDGYVDETSEPASVSIQRG